MLHFIPMGVLYTCGDLGFKRSKVKITVLYRKTVTKNINICHNYLQPSWILTKLATIIPMGGALYMP